MRARHEQLTRIYQDSRVNVALEAAATIIKMSCQEYREWSASQIEDAQKTTEATEAKQEECRFNADCMPLLCQFLRRMRCTRRSCHNAVTVACSFLCSHACSLPDFYWQRRSITTRCGRGGIQLKQLFRIVRVSRLQVDKLKLTLASLQTQGAHERTQLEEPAAQS